MASGGADLRFLNHTPDPLHWGVFVFLIESPLLSPTHEKMARLGCRVVVYGIDFFHCFCTVTYGSVWSAGYVWIKPELHLHLFAIHFLLHEMLHDLSICRNVVGLQFVYVRLVVQQVRNKSAEWI